MSFEEGRPIGALVGQGLLMTDITIENRDIRLAASVDGPANAKAILFLHGLSLSRDTWEETAKRLTNQYRVWTLDFRGHGHSDRASSYKLVDFVSDAETALATPRRSLLGKRDGFRGHSCRDFDRARIRVSGQDHPSRSTLRIGIAGGA